MFRFEIGAKIIVKKSDGGYYHDVEILAKYPNMIKAKILSDGWFKCGSIHWLNSDDWIPLGRVTS